MTDDRTNERGVAMLEFAIILPILLLIFFAATDLYRVFSAHQFMSVLSREAGNVAFRECTEEPSGLKTNQCLERFANEVFNNALSAGSSMRSARIQLKVFRYNAGANPTPTGSYLLGGSAPWAVSNITAAEVRNFKSYVEAKPVTVTAEVFYHVEPMLFLPLVSGDLLETTIF